jgi:hypothetical protein
MVAVTGVAGIIRRKHHCSVATTAVVEVIGWGGGSSMHVAMERPLAHAAAQALEDRHLSLHEIWQQHSGRRLRLYATAIAQWRNTIRL